MASALRVGFGLALALAVVAAGVFLARSLLSKDPAAFASSIKTDSWRGRAYLGAVLVGTFAVISMGVNSVLHLVLHPWPELSWTIAGFTGLGALALLSQLERLPRVRRDYEVLSEAGAWERAQLRFTSTPSDETIAGFLAGSQDATKTSVERGVLATKHGFAVALQDRDERLEAAVLRRLERAREEQVAEEERTRVEAAKALREAASRAAAQDLAERTNALVDSRVDPWPFVQSLEQVEATGVIDQAALMDLWAKFKRLVVEVAPTSPDAADASAARLASNLPGLSYVRLPSEVRVALVYNGNPRDGFCDVVASEADGTAPLYQRLHFEHALGGLANALFFAAALPRKWSWGHGFHDRDAELIIDGARLKSIVQEAGGKQPPDDAHWPPPGVRLRRLDNGFAVACLAARPGRGLYDLSIEVRDGKASPLKARDVFIWGQGVFY